MSLGRCKECAKKESEAEFNAFYEQILRFYNEVREDIDIKSDQEEKINGGCREPADQMILMFCGNNQSQSSFCTFIGNKPVKSMLILHEIYFFVNEQRGARRGRRQAVPAWGKQAARPGFREKRSGRVFFPIARKALL